MSASNSNAGAVQDVINQANLSSEKAQGLYSQFSIFSKHVLENVPSSGTISKLNRVKVINSKLFDFRTSFVTNNEINVNIMKGFLSTLQDHQALLILDTPDGYGTALTEFIFQYYKASQYPCIFTRDDAGEGQVYLTIPENVTRPVDLEFLEMVSFYPVEIVNEMMVFSGVAVLVGPLHPGGPIDPQSVTDSTK